MLARHRGHPQGPRLESSCLGQPQPMGDKDVMGKGVPEGDDLGLEEAAQVESLEAAVLHVGVDEFYALAAPIDRLSLRRIHALAPVLERRRFLGPLARRLSVSGLTSPRSSGGGA